MWYNKFVIKYSNTIRVQFQPSYIDMVIGLAQGLNSDHVTKTGFEPQVFQLISQSSTHNVTLAHAGLTEGF